MSLRQPDASRLPRLAFLLLVSAFLLTWSGIPQNVRAADRGSYRSDSDARYLHHIHLYDARNRRLGPDSTTPYSPMTTCGRCHDYDTISHGWHFNAFLADSEDGREGEPWIWTDARTGTQLPLSYRRWSHAYDPRTIGMDQWDMLKQFGGRLPGGGLGHAPTPESAEVTSADTDITDSSDRESLDERYSRWALSGSLEIDCLACHSVSGKYDFNARREQIEDENFAWAPTAALRIAALKGSVSRIKDGADPEDEAVQAKLPAVAYDESVFAPDGTVFVDLVRQPQNNACYQCHSQRTVDESGVEPRWIHDEDVHLRAGMQCIDCHRNGIDHHIVRGFAGEMHPSDRSMTTLSCKGCHLGAADSHGGKLMETTDRAGRLGSPKPAHAGLPPIHFEKLSCTACHGGPLPREEALGVLTSLAHSLGEKGHRSGEELPRLFGPVYAKQPDDRVYPHRVMWPAFWGSLANEQITPLDPNLVYDATRKSLRVRKEFTTEVLTPKLSSKELKPLLGEERYRVKPEERTEEETRKVASATAEAGKAQFNEKVAAALAAIEEAFDVEQAVYVSSGFVYAKNKAGDGVEKIEVADSKATGMIRWPMAHNVRPSGWSLGSGGCTECHSDDGKIFASTVAAVGPGPDSGSQVTMASIQGVDANQRLAWNELFRGRASFKYVIAGSLLSLAALLLTIFGVGLGRLGRKAS
ncbi:MAG: hypothetical protein AAFU85_07225 [Planctomycetota bacterium]